MTTGQGIEPTARNIPPHFLTRMNRTCASVGQLLGVNVETRHVASLQGN
ncbi:MAG TPA: hypothetical protein V6C85_22125 [Allocoleopsis sp.]